jgi:hypothetical protein
MKLVDDRYARFVSSFEIRATNSTNSGGASGPTVSMSCIGQRLEKSGAMPNARSSGVMAPPSQRMKVGG